MTLTPGMITTDSADPVPLATWWAEQTGASIVQHHGDGEFLVVAGGSLQLLLAFQKVPDPTPGKNLTHVDYTAEGLDAEVDRLVAAGASLVGRRGDDSFRWVTLADPQGNHFCVSEQADAAESYDTA